MKQKFRFTKYIMVFVMAALMMGAGLPAVQASTNAPVQMVPQNFSGLADSVSPAVVHIRVEKTVKGAGPMGGSLGQNPFGDNEQFKEFFGRHFGNQGQQEFKQPAQGSGFIIDKSGLIVTNNHVVADTDKITVILKDQSQYDAKVVGLDPVTDIALLKVDPKKDLPVVKMGSSDDLKVGEWVVAIGAPFGLEYTVTAGIVSAKGRVIGSGPYDDFIQTDASINPGNSGGPLINMKGEVVGINTMIIAGGQGIGFAIPVNQAKGIIAQLETNGEVTRGWLGVTIQDLNENLAGYYGLKDNKSGAMVADVVAGDPADKAGIKPKDIITEVNGKAVTSSRDLTNLAANLKVGEPASVTILRDGKYQTLEVKIGKRPLTLASARSEQNENQGEYGFQVTELTPEIARQYGIQESTGILVVGVTPDSKADAAGVQKGDLILEVNRVSVSSVQNFKHLLDSKKDSDGINLLVKRMNAGLMVIHLA